MQAGCTSMQQKLPQHVLCHKASGARFGVQGCMVGCWASPTCCFKVLSQTSASSQRCQRAVQTPEAPCRST